VGQPDSLRERHTRSVGLGWSTVLVA
jgi:hypothetical protein